VDSGLRQPTKLPPQVTAALVLIATDFLLSVLLTLKAKIAESFTTLLFAAALLAVLYSLWLLGLYRRKNWLRWFTVGGAAVGLLYLPWAWGILKTQDLVPVRLLKYLLFDAGAILLCLPQANRWYGRSDQ
jgi:hypothetical protein